MNLALSLVAAAALVIGVLAAVTCAPGDQGALNERAATYHSALAEAQALTR